LTTALAEHNQTIQALIDNLRTLLATLTKEGDKFSGTIDRIEQLVTQLPQNEIRSARPSSR
jgi:phospholipid/cholesterol/gamma-HCH transport system substrate-binding protein